MLTLVNRSFRRIAGLLTALVGLLLAFQMALVAVAASFESRDDFAGLAELVPAFMREAFGLALTSFSGMAVLGFFEPMPIMIVVQFAIYVATEPAADVESGLVDLILSRSLPRHQLITRSLVLMLLVTTTLAATMAAGTWLALLLLAPEGIEWPESATVWMLMGHLAAVGWCFGAIALAAGASARRRGTAQATVAIVSVALYLLDVLGESWAVIRPVARVSPFHYFHGAAILAGTARPILDFALLGTAAAAAIVLAYWRFRIRDL
jgi:hypothetical protein